MFTGLVQAVGFVRDNRRSSSGTRLVIHPSGWSQRPRAGDSICVAGVCLTVAKTTRTTKPRDAYWAFDVIPETLDKTTLSSLADGDRVNLEHAVTASTLMGGHFVQGHVDGVGTVSRVSDRRGDYRVRVRVAAELMPAIVSKGSIAIDGVSLTIAATLPRSREFEVALIPETLARTTLGSLVVGRRVNIETDMIAKTVVNVLRAFPGGRRRRAG